MRKTFEFFVGMENFTFREVHVGGKSICVSVPFLCRLLLWRFAKIIT